MVQRRWIVMVVAGLMLVAAVGCGNTPQSATAPTASPAANAASLDTVAAEGVVTPFKNANLAFQASGRVLKVLVAEGDTVTAGQELASLDTVDLQLAVQRAEAGLKLAQAQLDKAKNGARAEEVALAEAEVAIAKGNLSAARAVLASTQATLDKISAGPTDLELQIAEKQIELAKNQLWGSQGQRDVIGSQVEAYPPRASAVEFEAARAAVSVSEAQVAIAQLQMEQVKQGASKYDVSAAKAQVQQGNAGVQTAQAQLVQAEANLALVKAGSRPEDIAAAEANVTEAQSALSQAQNALSNAVLKAPFDGTIGKVVAQEGELVSPQLAAVRLGNLSRWRVETSDLSEADISQVKVGQKATVTVDALQGVTLNGSVIRVASLATDQRGDKVYTVTIDLDGGQDPGLRWGMSAFVEIQVK